MDTAEFSTPREAGWNLIYYKVMPEMQYLPP
jgi:hypothetical protein